MSDADVNPFDAIGFEPGTSSADPSSAPRKSGLPSVDLKFQSPTTLATFLPADASPDDVNPFDAIGFDDQPPAPSAIAPGKPGVLANAPDDSFWSGAAKNAGSTAIKGLSHAPGFVGDLSNFAGTLGEIPAWIEAKATGRPFADVEAEYRDRAAKFHAAQDQFEKSHFGISFDPTNYLPSGSDVSNWIANKFTGEYQPTTNVGRYASAAGEAALGAFGPGGGSALKGVVQHALPNAAAGVSSQAIGDATGDPLLAAVGGIGTAGAAGAMKGAPTRRAATILADAAEKPQQALSTIAAGNPDGVPGVAPTTAELTRDPGLYRLQNQVADSNPEAFRTLREQQNRGRLDALDSLIPDGNPNDVARLFSQHFDDISDRSQALVDQRLAEAQEHVASLPGQGLTADAYGTMLRGSLFDAENARMADENRLWDAVDPHNTLTNDMTGVKDAANNIYGNMPAADRAFMSPVEGSFAGLINGFSNIESFRQLASLKSNLASAMRQELRNNGRTPTYARMSRLMGPVQDAISGTVAQRAAADNAAVARGDMAPGNTISAFLRSKAADFGPGRDTGAVTGARAVGDGPGGSPPVPSEAGDGQRQQGRVSGEAGSPGVPTDVPRAPLQDGDGQVGGVGPLARPAASDQPNFPPTTPAAAVGSAQPTPRSAPTMDAEAAARYRAANEATKNRHAIFDAQPISDVLAEKGGRGNFKLPSSVVPGRLFPKGPGGFEAVEAFRRAVNDDQGALHLLRDHAVDSLRRDVMEPDGTLPAGKLEKWQADHEAALRAFPELADKFRDAATASRTYDQAVTDRKTLIRTYEKSAFGHLMNATHPEQVNAIVSNLMKSPKDLPVLRKLTDVAAKDPMALAGLRRAVLENVVDKNVSEIETLSGPQRTIRAKAFREMVMRSRTGLDIVLGKESTDHLNRIANSLPMAAQSIESIGQTKHADLARYLKAATRPHETLMDRLFKVGVITHELGEGFGEIFGGEHGGVIAATVAAAGLLGQKARAAIRATGARKVGDLITDAVLNPEQYAALAHRAPIRPDAGSETTLVHQLRRAAMFAPDAMAGVSRHFALRAPRLNDREEEQRRRAGQQRAAGGRVAPTDAQKEAGNYKKDHIRIFGMNIALENRRGEERTGVGKDGRRWSVKMPAAYGYIKGTEGADGDHVDCYVGPNPGAGYAYIIDQLDADTGRFDEHKVMLGFPDQKSAVETYKRGFSDGNGAARIGNVTRMPVAKLFEWAKSGAAKKPTKAAA